MTLLRGDEYLRRGRLSQRGCMYFITCCTHHRVLGLNATPVASGLWTEVKNCARDGHWRVAGGVIMPDHLHLLVELAGETTLSRIIARVKSKTRAVLAAHGLRWQGNFYEHRLRRSDSIEDGLRYLVLNPYRAGLVMADQPYPWFWVHPQEAAWFRPSLRDDRPFPEWLG